MSKREKLLNEFYNLYLRQLNENGLCEEDEKRRQELVELLREDSRKVALLDNGDITSSNV